MFPWGVPFGLGLIGWAVKRDDWWLAYAASPLMVPYFTIHTLLGPYLVLVTRDKGWALLAWIAGWAYLFATPGLV